MSRDLGVLDRLDVVVAALREDARLGTPTGVESSVGHVQVRLRNDAVALLAWAERVQDLIVERMTPMQVRVTWVALVVSGVLDGVPVRVTCTFDDPRTPMEARYDDPSLDLVRRLAEAAAR